MKIKEKLTVFLLYLVSVSVLYAPVVFAGKSVQSALLQPFGYTSGWPYGYEGRIPVNSFNLDLATQSYYEYPINKLAGDIYKRGELPLWNPYQAAGVPLSVQYSTRVYFPYQIIEDLSPALTWDFFMLGRLLLAGFFTFLFLRAAGLGAVASFAGGLMYMFSGAFTCFINLEEMTNAAMALPLHLYALELLASRGRPVHIAFAGATFALVILAGQPEIAFYCLFLGFCFYLLRAFMSGSIRTLRGMPSYFLSVLLGLGLSAPLVNPFVDFMGSSFHLHEPNAGFGTGFLPNWFKALGMFIPANLEVPLDYRLFPDNGAWDHLGGYTGVISLFLAATGLVLSFKGKRCGAKAFSIFFFSFAAFVLLKNLGIKPFLWAGHLPLFDRVWSQRWAGPSWIFSLSAAAAAGLEILKRQFEEKGTGQAAGTRAILLGAAGSLAILCFFTGASLLQLQKILAGVAPDTYFLNSAAAFRPQMAINISLAFIFLSGAAAILIYYSKTGKGLHAIFPLIALELWWSVNRGYDYDWQLYKLLPLATGAIALYAFFFRKWRTAGAGVLIFLAAFIVLDSASPRGLPKRYDPFKEPPYLTALKGFAGHDRIMGGYGLLYPNYAGAAGLLDLRFINSLSVPEFQEYKNAFLQNEPYKYHILWFTGSQLAIKYGGVEPLIEEDILRNLRHYSFLGMRYVVLAPGSGINSMAAALGLQTLEPVYLGRDAAVYINPYALPRAFVAGATRRAASYHEAQAILATQDFDPRNEAILEEALPDGFAVNEKAGGGSTAEITGYYANSVTIKYNSPENGILVLTDVYDKGWKASVDGAPSKVYRVDGLVRGVAITKGQHEVEFRYRPQSLIMGGWAFALSAVVCAGLSIMPSGKDDRKDDN